jgi:P-type E1-E2 ATPase
MGWTTLFENFAFLRTHLVTLFQIQVGDILCVEDDDELPCDLLLLSTSNPNGKASVLTANLDGETNLKVISPRSKSYDRELQRQRCKNLQRHE